MARPKGTTKLTPEVREAILSAIRVGVPRKFAAEAAGIHEVTLSRWLSEAKKKTGAKKELVLFLQDVKRAEAEMVQTCLARVLAGADRSWQAAAWALERTHPDYYALNSREIKELLKALKDERSQKNQPGGGSSPAQPSQGESGDPPAPTG